MIWLIQILAIQFAISLAKHDAPAVTQFEHYGLANKQMARFHRYNTWTKFFYCAAACLAMYKNWWMMAAAGGLSALWIWLLFDPALNVTRSPKRSFFYLGLNDADGRFWNGTFGRNSGKVKFIVLLLLIVAINLLIQFL